MCGETCAAVSSSPKMNGLSPRVRGNPPMLMNGSISTRSIPACAGKPKRSATARVIVWVYPRVCGETPNTPRAARMAIGLSPRVRGNRVPLSAFSSSWRSIPACAGKPQTLPGPPGWLSVYPRVCGETSRCEYGMSATVGLSPRVRGNHPGRPACGTTGGSIPACAGKPQAARPAFADSTVYPRVCGETYLRRMVRLYVGGLSPRVRGNPLRAFVTALYDGSIPACAGKPVHRHRLAFLWPVYPRVCGETFFVPYKLMHTYGLSPRVRGNHDCVA